MGARGHAGARRGPPDRRDPRPDPRARDRGTHRRISCEFTTRVLRARELGAAATRPETFRHNMRDRTRQIAYRVSAAEVSVKAGCPVFDQCPRERELALAGGVGRIRRIDHTDAHEIHVYCLRTDRPGQRGCGTVAVSGHSPCKAENMLLVFVSRLTRDG